MNENRRIKIDYLRYFFSVFLQFKTKILKTNNLQTTLDLSFASFVRMREFIYVEKSKYNFRELNLTWNSISFFEDSLFLFISLFKTDIFWTDMKLTIVAFINNSYELWSFKHLFHRFSTKFDACLFKNKNGNF